MISGAQISALVRQFLQIATGKDVKYSYSLEKPTADVVITYQFIGGQGMRRAIDNELLSERKMYLAVIQAKTAKDVHFYIDMIKQTSNKSPFMYISEGVGKDPTVVNGWRGTVTISYYNNITEIEGPKQIFTEEEARALLQAFADRFIFTTSIYGATIDESVIDSYEVPPLTDATIEDILTAQQQIVEDLTGE